MTHSTTTYHQVSRIELDFTRDPSEPSFSFLRLLIYSPSSPNRAHSISFFASDALAADHLHNIFLASNLLADADLTRMEPSNG